MSEFRDIKFVKEFTYRTLLNYYKRKLHFSTNTDEKCKIQDIIDRYELEMRSQGYIIEEYYEVTDILNSLIGLLVLPEQNVFENISKNENVTKTKFFELYQCTLDNSYINTYHGQKGKRSPFALFLHMKNALSHNRVMIYPQNSASNNTKTIKEIVFQDALLRMKAKNNGKWKPEPIDKFQGDLTKYKLNDDEEIQVFSITIPVNKLEDIIVRIAEYLTSLA